MKFLSAKSQMSLGLVCLQVSVLCGAMLFGLVPDRRSAVMNGRADLCESVAIVSSQLMSRNQLDELNVVLNDMVERNQQLLSAGIRNSDQQLLTEIGDHAAKWTSHGSRSTEDEILVPILSKAERWGNVELRFAAVSRGGVIGFLVHPWVQMTLTISAVSCVLFYFYLRKMLKHLDPSRAVPRRVRAALDSLAEGLLVLDREGRIVLANHAFGEWVGVDAEKLTGVDAKSFNWLTRCESVFTTGYPWTDALKQETAQAGVMISLAQPDRPVQNLMANASPVLGYDGKYGGVLVSFDDVTQLEETRKELEAAMTVAEDAQQIAEDASKAKSEFLARMSHEIRTPMNAILGYTEVLRNGFAEKIEDRLNYLDTINASGEHLMALINDILDVSKIEAGRLELELKPYSLRELISHVISAMRVKAEEKQIGLEFEAATPVPETVLTDVVRFRQALFNLVGNAVKFTSEGTVRVVVGMAGKLVKVDVIDTGIGIAPDALEKVFDRFTQADVSVSGQYGGTGLGLSIARQLSRKMGGDVAIQSVLGQGSTFSMTFDPGPLQGIALVDPTSEEYTSHQNGSEVATLQLPPCRILIVDDEKANRDLAAIYISRAGGKYLTAENGQQAVELVGLEHFDAILMDLHMPELDGTQATRYLRQRGCTTPIIALTANIMEDDEKECRAAGCDGFLHKPIKMADLISGLCDVLDVDAESTPSDEDNVTTRHNVTPEEHHEILEDILENLNSKAGTEMTHDDLPETIESSLPTDDAEFCEIVAEFVPRLKDRVALIRPCFDTNDMGQLREHAHWLAGSGESVGFALFSEPARELEHAAIAENTDVMPDLILQLERIAERIVTPVAPVAESVTA